MQASAQMNVINQSNSAEHTVLSKVVVVEHDPRVLAEIKSFFEDCQLVGYRTTMEHAPTILGSTIDLGAIFLAEADSEGRTMWIASTRSKQLRPSLSASAKKIAPKSIVLPSIVGACSIVVR